MTPFYADDTVTIHHGDCLNILPTLPAASVDAIVTDPPAGVSFMGRDWDSDRGGRDAWIAWLGERMSEAYRVLKPGGHALVWALPRTSHWTAMALEDAGFEIRDCVLHLYGSGFPKSHDVSAAIDKAAGATRNVIGEKLSPDGVPYSALHGARSGRAGGGIMGEAVPVSRSSELLTAPATDDARRWSGWGTALKPGQEIWWLVRKPLAGTVAGNVLEHGTGAINVDACRVGDEVRVNNAGGASSLQRVSRVEAGYRPTVTKSVGKASEVTGRWPTNLLLTHSASCGDTSCSPDCPVADLDQQSGVRTSGSRKAGTYGLMGYMGADASPMPAIEGDSGGASRYFPIFRYEAKAKASERPRGEDGTAHVTVKPLALMRWLVRLVTPPGGTVLDPFLGSGTTAEACLIEGFRCIGIEKDEAHLPLIKARLSKPIQPTLGFEAAS